MRDAHGEELDPVWMAEFRGFFFGEGYLGITTNGRGRGKVYHIARAAITLRDDDEPVLREIQKRLGGLLHRERCGRVSHVDGTPHQTKPFVVWRVTSKSDVARVCDILDAGHLPSKKRREIAVMRAFLATVGITKKGPKGLAEQLEHEQLTATREALAAQLRAYHSYPPKRARPRGEGPEVG